MTDTAYQVTVSDGTQFACLFHLHKTPAPSQEVADKFVEDAYVDIKAEMERRIAVGNLKPLTRVGETRETKFGTFWSVLRLDENTYFLTDSEPCFLSVYKPKVQPS